MAESMKQFERALDLNPDIIPIYDEVVAVYAYEGDHAKESEYAPGRRRSRR
jgi:hypothetical protein